MKKNILNIGLHEDRLRKRSEPVYFNEKGELPIGTRSLIEDMRQTLRWHRALGLAAPQVNETLRIILVDEILCAAVDRGVAVVGDQAPPLVLIDPVVVERSRKLVTHQEGCLSIPGCVTEIDRPASVTVRALAPDHRELVLEASGYFAACLQHEIDHLDGALFIDKASRIKREWFRKRLQKERAGRAPAAWYESA